ncbi:hypothetical protein D3C72_1701900 [compost metagenome]
MQIIAQLDAFYLADIQASVANRRPRAQTIATLHPDTDRHAIAHGRVATLVEPKARHSPGWRRRLQIRGVERDTARQ